MNLTVDFNEPIGTLKPLHGLNNGPISFGSMLDNRHRYRELGVPWVRLHDTNWPHPREVDVSQIVPDFDADASDPASYCFGPTDDYLRSIRDTGARIIYRLGVSIEHYARRRFVFEPADHEQWARFCLGIVRHYTDGWADGIADAVDYWEIWNEADIGIKMWSGSYEQYMELYRVTATALKAYNPALQVGGPAHGILGAPGLPQFMAFCRQHQLPLDFYTWHLYARTPDQLVDESVRIHNLLTEHGYGATPCFVTEWNWLPSPWDVLCGQDECLRRDGFERLKREEGAAFCASVLIKMQDAPVAIMNYYDGQAMSWFCGLFDYYGVPQKTFYAFKAFHALLDYPVRVRATCDIPGVDVLAARSADAQRGALLIANFGAYEGRVTINAGEAGDAPVEILHVDRDHDLMPTGCRNNENGAFVTGQAHLQVAPATPMRDSVHVLNIRRHAVCLARFGGG